MNYDDESPLFNARELNEVLNSNIEIEWIVEGVLRRNGKSGIVADAGVGKTIFLLQLGWSIASQTKFLDKFNIPKPLNVLFLDTELGPGPIDTRIKIMNIKASKTQKNYFVSDANGLDLTKEFIKEAVIEYIKKERIEVLLVDSIVYLHDFDENGTEMKKFFLIIDEINKRTNCSTFVSHHTSQADPRGYKGGRGSTVFKGWVDTLLSLENDENPRKLNFRKARFIEKPKEKLQLYLSDCWFELNPNERFQKEKNPLDITIKQVIPFLREMEGGYSKTAIYEMFLSKKGIQGLRADVWYKQIHPELTRLGWLVEVTRGKYEFRNVVLPEASGK